jgi:hypothetical protein
VFFLILMLATDFWGGWVFFCCCSFACFCNTGAWTQSLHLEALHQSFFCDFFWARTQTICPNWLWTMIFLISASCIARITGMSHQRPAVPFPCYFGDWGGVSFFGWTEILLFYISHHGWKWQECATIPSFLSVELGS